MPRGNSNSNSKKWLFVNYGNCLDSLGRVVEALYAYDKALKIDPNFSMAIGNKAIAMKFFADISGKYRGAIYIEAYQAITSIINKQDIISCGSPIAKQAFENELKEIESHFKSKEDLTKKIYHEDYNISNLSDFEKFFLNFCIKEKLFLNFHIQEDNCEAAVADPIFITIITDVKDDNTFYELAKHINQIKEDYIVSRLLLIQSQYRSKDFDNISQRTTFVNTPDNSKFNLYNGLLKTAFKQAYNILDKIATCINSYYNLGLDENHIYFTSIWQKKDRDEIRDEILKTQNTSLHALYDIYLDIKSGYFKKIQDIRNAATHNKLVIYDSISTNCNEKGNIDYDTMVSETINLMQLAKSAIIYLINFITFTLAIYSFISFKKGGFFLSKFTPAVHGFFNHGMVFIT